MIARFGGLKLPPLPPRRSKVRFAPFFFCKKKRSPASLPLLLPKKPTAFRGPRNSSGANYAAIKMTTLLSGHFSYATPGSFFAKIRALRRLCAYECAHNHSRSLLTFCDSISAWRPEKSPKNIAFLSVRAKFLYQSFSGASPLTSGQICGIVNT